MNALGRLGRRRRDSRNEFQSLPPFPPFMVDACECIRDGAFALLRVNGTGVEPPAALVADGQSFDPLPSPDPIGDDGSWRVAFALPAELTEGDQVIWLHDSGDFRTKLSLSTDAAPRPAPEAPEEPAPDAPEDPAAEVEDEQVHDSRSRKLVEAWSEAGQLRQKLVEREEELSDALKDLLIARKLVKPLEDAADSAAEQLAAVRRDAEHVHAEAKESRRGVAEKVAELDAARTELDAARAELAAARAAAENAGRADEEVVGLRGQVAALELEVADLRGALEQQIAGARTELESARAAHAEAVERAAEAQAASARAEAEAAGLREQVAALQQELAHTKAGFDHELAAAKAASEQELADAKAASEQELAAAKAASEQQVAAAKAASEQELADTKAASEQQLADAKAALEQELASTKAALEQELASTKGTLEQELSGAKSVLSQMESEAAKREKSAAKLQSELDKLQDEKKQRRRAVGRRSEDHAVAKAREELEARVAEQVQRIEQQQQRIGELEREAASFGERRDDAVAESLRETVKKLQEEVRQQETCSDDLRALLDSEREQVARFRGEAHALKGQLAIATSRKAAEIEQTPEKTSDEDQSEGPAPTTEREPLPWSGVDDELLARIEKAKALTS